MQDEVSEIALDVRRADGGTLPVILNAALRRDAAGRPALVRITLFDATDRLRFDREIQAARRAEGAARERVEHLQRITSALAATVEPERVAEILAAGIGDAVPGVAVTVEVAGDGEDSPPPDAAPATGEASGAAVLVVPMLLGDRPVGAVTVRHPEGLPLGDEERALISAATAQGALGLARARLFARERTIAYELQRHLLASEPVQDPRCHVATHYQPGVAGLQVGGDWHDAFEVAGGLVGVGVGDVVGRGLEAASAMGQLRSAIRALTASGMAPAAVFEQMDEFVAGVPGAWLTTAVLAVIDPATGHARYACSGHPPPVHVPAEGPPALLWDARSRPLGAPRDAPREQAEVTLAPGDALLLYTDGVMERRREPIDVSFARLTAAVAQRGQRSPIDAVRAALLDGAPQDDACLLCVTYAGAGPGPPAP
jgi:serine phosphatase RsbU (regulator of sigma subunit)